MLHLHATSKSGYVIHMILHVDMSRVEYTPSSPIYFRAICTIPVQQLHVSAGMDGKVQYLTKF